VHHLGSAFFLCVWGTREKWADEMSVLWQWIRQARAVVEKWERVEQVVAFIQRADQFGYVRRKKKATY